MASQATNPTPTETIPVQRTMTKMADFSEVTLKKERTFTRPQTSQEVLALINNDAQLYMRILIDGLKAHLRRQLAADSTIPWHVLDEDGSMGAEFNEEVVESSIVNNLVNTFAKLNGYSADLPKDKKKELKDKAREFVRKNAVTLLSAIDQSQETDES